MINILITAGGTSENIDSVRSISNHATGRLGSLIADAFAQTNPQITYVCGENALLPTVANAEVLRIRNVKELMETMETLLSKRSFDCVIHSMAVSDYTPDAVLSVDEIIERIVQTIKTQKISEDEIANKIRASILESKKPFTEQKMSSKASAIALLLKKTPKVIRRIKEIQPQTFLVGFKLLSHVPEPELIQAGQKLLEQNACDLVLVNDLANIKNNEHQGILLDSNGILQRAYTKERIAEMIFKYVMEGISK